MSVGYCRMRRNDWDTPERETQTYVCLRLMAPEDVSAQKRT